jgi:PAS domain S-box-containing protein
VDIAVLRAALRSAGTGVWEWDIDADRLVEADLGFEQLGYAPGELEHSQALWNTLIHPDDREANERAYQRHASGEAPLYLHRYRVLAKDGRWHWFEERGQIVERHPDGRPKRMLGTQTDITAQLALHEAAERLERFPQHVPGMLFQFRREADGRAWFPYVSERCEALIGLAPELLRADAAPMLRLMPREQRQPMLDSIADSAATLRRWRLQFWVQVEGATRCLRGSATPQPQSDGATLWHGYVEDVTELLALEQAQRDKAAAEAASRAKTEFLSRISHELRTPLNAVLGFAQLLQADPRDPPSEGQRARLALILDSGRHLLQMIGDLLDLTRAESGALALRPEALDALALAREAAAMLAPQAAAAQVALAVAEGAAPPVWADTTRLRQVLLNLIGNAVKYNCIGGRVAVTAEAAGARLRVTVADTGQGIAAEELPRLFEPFYRGQRQAVLVADGAGIGLAVTRSLVQAMGGGIEVESALGAGSRFTVSLPLAADATAAGQSVSLPA